MTLRIARIVSGCRITGSYPASPAGIVLRSRLVGSVGCVALPAFCLVSLVSAWSENWTQTAENIETIEIVERVEIANVHAVFMHLAENMIR